LLHRAFILAVIRSPLVRRLDEAFEDVDVVTLARTTTGSHRRRLLQPCSSGVFISLSHEFVGLRVAPTGHGKGLASVADGLMRRFAVVAHEGVEFNANRGKTKLLVRAAVGARAVGGKPRKLPDLLLSRVQGHGD